MLADLIELLWPQAKCPILDSWDDRYYWVEFKNVGVCSSPQPTVLETDIYQELRRARHSQPDEKKAVTINQLDYSKTYVRSSSGTDVMDQKVRVAAKGYRLPGTE